MMARSHTNPLVQHVNILAAERQARLRCLVSLVSQHAVRYLYAGPGLVLADAAEQGPAAAGDVGHVGDGLHLLWVPDAHLQHGHRRLPTHPPPGYQHTHNRVTITPTTGLPSHPQPGYHHTQNRVTNTPTAWLP